MDVSYKVPVHRRDNTHREGTRTAQQSMPNKKTEEDKYRKGWEYDKGVDKKQHPRRRDQSAEHDSRDRDPRVNRKRSKERAKNDKKQNGYSDRLTSTKEDDNNRSRETKPRSQRGSRDRSGSKGQRMKSTDNKDFDESFLAKLVAQAKRELIKELDLKPLKTGNRQKRDY